MMTSQMTITTEVESEVVARRKAADERKGRGGIAAVVPDHPTAAHKIIASLLILTSGEFSNFLWKHSEAKFTLSRACLIVLRFIVT